MRYHSQNMVCSSHITNLPTPNYFASMDVVPILVSADANLEVLDQAVTYKVKFTFKLIFNLNQGYTQN